MLPKTSLLFCLLIAALSLAQFSQAAEAEQTIFLHLTPAEYQTALDQQWPMLYTLDYGSFYWVEVNPLLWQRLTTSSGVNFDLAAADFKLSLSNRVFDPLLQPTADASTELAHTADYQLIQFVGPTKQAWLTQLQAAGLEPVQYIHPYTYVVWGTAQALSQTEARSASWPYVRWHGPFTPEFRLQTISPTERLTTDEKRQPFKLLLYRQADNHYIQNEIEALDGTFVLGQPLNEQWLTAEVSLPAKQLSQAAAIAGVYSIQSAVYDGGSRGEFSSLINVGQHDSNFESIPGYWHWLTQAGVTGREVIVATVDEGLLETHPDLIARMHSCVGATCGNELHSLHGTHTAGIIAADGASNTKDQDGFLRGLGVAPEAQLVEQIYRQQNNTLFDLQLLMQEAAANGAVISSNSWGPNSTPQGYDMNTMTVDIGVRDANPAVAGNQSLTYVVAMMNGYGGTSTQGSPDEAKNIITVGSTKVRTSSGSPYNTVNDLSINTAHGPALDGRHIPHIVAPGYYIDSTDNNGGYRYLFGTSMAAPQVSGAAALFIDYYRQQFATDPSPAMIKAAILPVAHDLAGYQDADGSMLN
ncbi:MAG: S8 family serine peptidase, partial [Anaerolineales bacterium]|nr:S8 family serine peptidase [Anaerolineales bacterium]